MEKGYDTPEVLPELDEKELLELGNLKPHAKKLMRSFQIKSDNKSKKYIFIRFSRLHVIRWSKSGCSCRTPQSAGQLCKGQRVAVQGAAVQGGELYFGELLSRVNALVGPRIKHKFEPKFHRFFECGAHLIPRCVARDEIQLLHDKAFTNTRRWLRYAATFVSNTSCV